MQHGGKGELSVYILKVGFHYESAPIAIREKFSFADNQLELAQITLYKQKSVLENIIVSTCNRTEVYAVVDQLHTGRFYIKQFLADWFNIPIKEFEQYLEIKENDVVVSHLFCVTAGLNSMILGETQILGQVRHAFLTAQAVGTSGTIFNELFKQAITFSKRVHNETAINEHALSIGNAVLKIIGDNNRSPIDDRIVLFGAGEMASITLQQLLQAGYKHIVIVNRSVQNGEKLAAKYKVKSVAYEDFQGVIDLADIIISATSANEPILLQQHFTRSNEKKIIIDLAVPRNIEPVVKNIKQLKLYDVDDLQYMIMENVTARKKAANIIEVELMDELVKFNQWVATLGVVPILRDLREKALTIQQETYESIKRKIPNLTEREERVINKHTKSIINQLLKEPIIQAKEMAGKADSDVALSTFINIFGLDEHLKNG